MGVAFHHRGMSLIASSASTTRPLVVTADPELLDDLLRLAAVASQEVEVASSAAAAVRSWRTAPVVLVGADTLDALLVASPQRRPGVLLVVDAEPDAGLWRRAVALGAEHVVTLPAGEPWLVQRLSEGQELPSQSSLVCVVGARGGVGASAVASAVALASARSGSSTMLIDCDPWGGGIDLALGLEDQHGLRWPGLARSAGRVSPSALIESLPHCEGVAVLSWDRDSPVDIAAAAAEAVLDGAARGCDLVVCDVPRVPGELGELALRRASHIVVMVPREVRAVAAATRLVGMLSMFGADLSLITRGPSPSGLDAYAVSQSLGLPLVADVRTESRIAAATERGEPPRQRSQLGRVAAAVLSSLIVTRRAA